MMNANELLTAAYNKCADAIIATIYQEHSFKQSDLKFRVYTAGQNETWMYQIQFEKPIDMGVGTYSQFNFKTKEDLGKFLFEAGANGGFPKGAVK